MPKKNTPKPKRNLVVIAADAANAVHDAIPHKSSVENITKGDLIAFAERIALVAVEKAVG